MDQQDPGPGSISLHLLARSSGMVQPRDRVGDGQTPSHPEVGRLGYSSPNLRRPLPDSCLRGHPACPRVQPGRLCPLPARMTPAKLGRVTPLPLVQGSRDQRQRQRRKELRLIRYHGHPTQTPATQTPLNTMRSLSTWQAEYSGRAAASHDQTPD